MLHCCIVSHYKMAERRHRCTASVVVLVLVVWSAGAAVRPAQSAACNIYALASCLAYAKSAQVPSRACCNAVASLGGGVVGAECLCSLMNSQAARQYGVVPEFAIGMPFRCGIPVPWHETCNDMRVPGGW